MAIQSFKDKRVEDFFVQGKLKKGVGWASLKGIVKRKLDMMEYSTKLIDLRSPPANRLEALKGDREGFYSIRINDQWRIVFQWSQWGPSNVNVEDYHS